MRRSRKPLCVLLAYREFESPPLRCRAKYGSFAGSLAPKVLGARLSALRQRTSTNATFLGIPFPQPFPRSRTGGPLVQVLPNQVGAALGAGCCGPLEVLPPVESSRLQSRSSSAASAGTASTPATVAPIRPVGGRSLQASPSRGSFRRVAQLSARPRSFRGRCCARCATRPSALLRCGLRAPLTGFVLAGCGQHCRDLRLFGQILCESLHGWAEQVGHRLSLRGCGELEHAANVVVYPGGDHLEPVVL